MGPFFFPKILLGFIFLQFPASGATPNIHIYHPGKYAHEKKVENMEKEQYAKNLRENCSTYEEELKEMKLDLGLVKRFREDYLVEHYEELLGLYSEFWNHVYHVWFNAAESDKKVITDFRRDWRQKQWYFKKKDYYAEVHAQADLKDEYRPRFKKFAEKYFDIEPFDPRGWAFHVRHGKNNLVFPPGSVIELEEGELQIARHSRIRVPPEMGGFIMHLKIMNDIYASRIKVISQKGNFRLKKPSVSEIMASARKGSRVDEEDPDFDSNEDRLDLLLDERYDRCGFAAKAKVAVKTPLEPIRQKQTQK